MIPAEDLTDVTLASEVTNHNDDNGDIVVFKRSWGMMTIWAEMERLKTCNLNQSWIKALNLLLPVDNEGMMKNWSAARTAFVKVLANLICSSFMKVHESARTAFIFLLAILRYSFYSKVPESARTAFVIFLSNFNWLSSCIIFRIFDSMSFVFVFVFIFLARKWS